MLNNVSKDALTSLDVTGLTRNREVINYLRNLADLMIQHRSRIGVDVELQYAQLVAEGKLTDCQEDSLEYEKGVDQAIDGVSAGKRDDAISWHTDLIIGQLDKLFKNRTHTQTPTPCQRGRV